MNVHDSCPNEFVSSDGHIHCKECVPPDQHLIKVEHTIPHPDDESKCLLHFASPVVGYLEKYPGLLMFEDAKCAKELPKRGDRICLNIGVVRGVMAHHLIGAKRKKAGADADQSDLDEEDEEGEDKRKVGDKSRVKPDPDEPEEGEDKRKVGDKSRVKPDPDEPEQEDDKMEVGDKSRVKPDLDEPEEGEDKRKVGEKNKAKPDPFETLPEELLLSIFTSLDNKSAMAAAATSKRFRDLVNDRTVYERLSLYIKDKEELVQLAKRAYINGSIDLLIRTLSHEDVEYVNLIFKNISLEHLGPYSKYEAMMLSPLKTGVAYANAITGPRDDIQNGIRHNWVNLTTVLHQYNAGEVGVPLLRVLQNFSAQSEYVFLEQRATGWHILEPDDQIVARFVLPDIALMAMRKDNQELFGYVLTFFLSTMSTVARHSGMDNFFRGMLPYYLHEMAATNCLVKLSALQGVLTKHWASSVAITGMITQATSDPEKEARLAIVQSLVADDIVNVRSGYNLTFKFSTLPLADNAAFNVSACLMAALLSGNIELFRWLALYTNTLYGETSIDREFDSPLFIYLVSSIIDNHLLEHGVLQQEGARGLDLMSAKIAFSIIMSHEGNLEDKAIKNSRRSTMFQTLMETFINKIDRSSYEDRKAAAASAIYKDVVLPLQRRLADFKFIKEDDSLRSMLYDLLF